MDPLEGHYPINNSGIIRAGNGGDGIKCGGQGGSMMIFGRNTTNTGEIHGGNGGNVLGTGAGYAGQGGDTHIWGKYGGPGFLDNDGLIRGGDGGKGNPYATNPQRGGDGGRLKLISLPSVFLDGGQNYAGKGGQGTSGGTSGRDGHVIIEPNTISLAGSGTKISGGDIVIFGGGDWTLDLSNMSSGAIVATGNITLAVGAGGVVDLRGSTTSTLQAGGRVMIASDSILLDTGAALSEIAGANVVTDTSRILNDVSLIGPGQVNGQPGIALPIHLTVLNGGPVSDTYTLTRTDSAGWALSVLTSPITIQGLDSFCPKTGISRKSIGE